MEHKLLIYSEVRWHIQKGWCPFQGLMFLQPATPHPWLIYYILFKVEVYLSHCKSKDTNRSFYIEVLGLPFKIPYHKNIVGFFARYNDHLYNDVFQHCSTVLGFFLLNYLGLQSIYYSVGRSEPDTLTRQTGVFVSDTLWKCMSVYQ